MLDIGWTELVVVAIVLIVVVGPKDLPPMLRAFGKMMTKFRGMASDFRQQFDEALKEADLDDVRKTLSDAQRLNPAHSLREAMNPLRQMGNDIKADLQKATATPPKVETPAAEPAVASEPVTAQPVTQVESPSVVTPTPVIDPVTAMPTATVGSVPVADPKPKRTAKAKTATEPHALPLDPSAKPAKKKSVAADSAEMPAKAPRKLKKKGDA